jgi:hypothetical protein
VAFIVWGSIYSSLHETGSGFIANGGRPGM